MSFGDLFKRKSKQKNPARQAVPEKRSGSEDADIIQGREPVNKQDLLFYRKNTPGKGDSEVAWILLQPVAKGYRAVYKCAYAGYGEAFPSLDTMQTKELPLPCSLVTNRDYRNLIKTLNRAFQLNLTAENCVGYSRFSHWVSYVLGESPVMKPSNPVLDRVWMSLSRKEFAKLLLGKDGYFFPDREYPGIHDYSTILSSGIYPYNSQDETLQSVFEETLLQLIHGSMAELLTAFEYIWRHKICEYRGTAPFSLDPKCVEVLKAQILTQEAELKQYKERYEFGSMLQEGAWEYIHNIHRTLEEEYGRHFL